MRASVAPKLETRPAKPTMSLAEWTRVINMLALNASRARTRTARAAVGDLLLNNSDQVVSAAKRGSRTPDTFGYRMVPEVAEHLVAEGMDPDFLVEFAAISGLEPRDVLDFAGIDRTTVSRRKATGMTLPHNAAVKVLQITDLMTQATEAFGSPDQAMTWLTKPHPSLGGETPLRRARTPWGMTKVQSILVALRYGGAA
jgi:putative toxin-antitoxin system antitoxin component (TIGR02293 family)